MKYAVEMGSGAMIYITKFHEDWFRHSKVGRSTDIKIGWRSHMPTFIFAR
jgi:hypothetical protein